MNKKFYFKKSSKGFVLAPVIVILSVLLVVTYYFAGNIVSELAIARNQKNSTKAFYIAEAGVERAIWQINQTGNTYTGETDTAFAGGKFTTVVANTADPNQKNITSTGYYPANNAYPAKRTLKITAQAAPGENVAFSYAIQSGNGGIEMSGASLVDPGSLYSNGNITLGNNNYVSGDAYAVGTISAPNCNLAQKKGICGNRVENAPSVPLPSIDYNFWIAEAKTGGTIDSYRGTPETIGPKEILGDFELTGGTVTITGPVYVHGKIKISGGTILKPDEGFASNNVFVITDDTIDIAGGTVFQTTSSTPSGYIAMVSRSAGDSAITSTGGTYTRVILYAQNGSMTVNGSAHIVAIAANTLKFTGTGSVTYENGLSGHFSSGPGGSWQKKPKSWQEVIPSSSP